MIRTSGEARISNFLLWEGVGAQLYVTPTLWPDFGADELERAIDLVASPGRTRRLTGAPGREKARSRTDAHR